MSYLYILCDIYGISRFEFFSDLYSIELIIKHFANLNLGTLSHIRTVRDSLVPKSYSIIGTVTP